MRIGPHLEPRRVTKFDRNGRVLTPAQKPSERMAEYGRISDGWRAVENLKAFCHSVGVPVPSMYER